MTYFLISAGNQERTHDEAKESISELFSLCETLKEEVLGTFTCELNSYHSGTFIGQGKIEEIHKKIEFCKPQRICFYENISPSQERVLSQIWGIEVINRQLLILEIFKKRAKSYEGKLQVELAGLLHQKSRVIGSWMGLSRQAGVGSRGPGEQLTETDRRVLEKRISQLKKKIKNLESHRKESQKKRKSTSLPSFALVGYTNSGKTTLFEALTKKHQDSLKDELFATLDTKTNKFSLSGAQMGLITDTVGFIKNLPVALIEAFKGTLDEIHNVDVLIHVVDITDKNKKSHQDITLKILKDLNWNGPILHVYNKIDASPQSEALDSACCLGPRVFISAKNSKGLEILKQKIKDLQVQLQKT